MVRNKTFLGVPNDRVFSLFHAGFTFRRHKGNRRILCERADLQAARAVYLRKIKDAKQNHQRKIVYLDETAVNENHTFPKEWASEDGKVGRSIPVGKGKRLVLLHAMSNEGFIPNCELLFQAHSTDGRDFHSEMNATVFENWVSSKLIPNLDPSSVIVMDNASYHSRLDPDKSAPTSKAKKATMIEWLERNGIPFDKKMLKPEIYKLVVQHKPPKEYVVDNLLKSKGHQVLRLPPYHCDLNPIENIWGIAKNKVARRNSTFKISDTKLLMHEELQAIDVSVFRNTYRRTQDIEDRYWKEDGMSIAPIVPRIRIDLNEPSSSSSVSSSSSESEQSELENENE